MTRFLNVNVFIDSRIGGGTGERTFRLSRALAAAGVDTTVLCLDIGLDHARLAALERVRVVRLPCVNRRFLLPGRPYDALERAVSGADVIQLTNHWTLLNALVYRIARRAGKPWIVCPAGSLAPFGRSILLKRVYNAAVGRRMVREAAGLVAITPAEREQFAEYDVPSDRTWVVPNGVDIEEFERHDAEGFRASTGLDCAPFVLFVGRLNPIKGPDLLLEAFARLRPDLERYHLVFAGPDEGLRMELEGRARTLGVQGRVHFAGYLDAERKSSAYHAAELVAVPSRQEAMSIVALEAGACATPVLLTDTCGFPEVAAERGGLVVAPRVEALAEGLEALLGAAGERAAMGMRLHELVRTRYTWAAAAERYRRIFEAVAIPTACAS
jgi:glycosyltransferase involved in cell wall biosynthesis